MARNKKTDDINVLDNTDITLEEKYATDQDLNENIEYLDSWFMSAEDYDIFERCREIVKYFRDNVFPVAFDIVKQKKLYNADIRMALDRAWLRYKSAEIYPLILPIHDTYCSNLHDSNLVPRVIPVTNDDIEMADIGEKYLNRALDVSDKGNLEKVWNEAALLWDSYCTPWYDIKEQTVVDENGNREKYNILIPKLYPVSRFELFYTIGARTFESAPEKIRRRFVSYSSLPDVYWPIWDEIEDKLNNTPWLEQAILFSPNYISKADFTKIYDIDRLSYDLIQGIVSEKWEQVWVAYENAFNVLLSNGFGEVIELYTQGKMILFFNGYKLYDWASPFYYEYNQELSQEWPFIWIYYEDTIGTRPMGIGQKLMPHQRKCNQLWNTISDGMYQNLNPMYWVVRGAMVGQDGNAPSMITYEEGKCFNVEPWYANGWVTSLNFIDPTILSLSMNYLNSIKDDAYTIIWVNSYTVGWQGKIERTWVAVNQRVEATRSRLAPIIKSIGRAYSKLFYHWINLGIKNGIENTLIRLWDNDDKDFSFTKIDLVKLNKDFNIVCSAESQEEALRASKSEGIIRVLNSLTPFVNSPYTGMPIYNTDEAVAEAVRQVGIKWLRPMSVDETKKMIDEGVEIQMYQQQKTQEAQQEIQQAAQPTLNDVAWQMDESQLPQEAMWWPMWGLEQYYGEMPQGVGMEWNIPIDVTQLTPEQVPEEGIMLW